MNNLRKDQFEKPTREFNAKVVLDSFLLGKRLSQKELTMLACMEDSGRIIDHIRRKLLVPVECDRKSQPTVWFIEDIEIYRYNHDREKQIADQQAKLVDNRINKIIEWAIEIALTDKGKQCISEALVKVSDAIEKKRQTDKTDA